MLVAPGHMRDKLSLRNVAEMLLTRGFSFTHETECAWKERLAPLRTALEGEAPRQGGPDVAYG